MKPRRTVNPKRKLRPSPIDPTSIERLRVLSATASYGGNPEHKKNPGDFGLSPPALPRQGKSLCDDAGVFHRSEALRLLKCALERGLVSVQERNGWPQNVWAMAKNGIPIEGMLENPEIGSYHGYPMLPIDPLIEVVKSRWAAQ
ncbi:MAG: hypothetical protein IPG63_11685 [Xanthomonadales bacterium]|nr:hypothetical protein [Xanthomonadales bacterium]MBK7145714.1 hypothetical protein [Xanthomonadales bacterium]MCC6562985.1 hypothetical protein [Xanthomonadales bacterium]